MPKLEPIMTAWVIKTWRASDPDVVGLQAGEIVRIGKRNQEWPGWVWCTGSSGKGCWVPESYLVAHAEGLTGWLRQDYSPIELDVSAGEMLHLHHEVSGWWWATNAYGESGWVPSSHLDNLAPVAPDQPSSQADHQSHS